MELLLGLAQHLARTEVVLDCKVRNLSLVLVGLLLCPNGKGGGGTLAQQQLQSGAFGMSSTFAAEAGKPNAFTGASFTQMRG